MSINLTNSEKNAADAFEFAMKMCKVQFSSYSLRERLYLHANFPSFASYSDVLTSINVPHLAVTISAERLLEAPLPIIIHFEQDGGSFAVIRKATRNNVEWLDTRTGWRSETLDSFASKWRGSALIMSPNTTSGEADYSNKIRQENKEILRTPISILFLILPCVLLYFSFGRTSVLPPAYKITYLLSKFAGVWISMLILLKTTNNENSFIRTLCNPRKLGGCNDILNSKASSLFGWVTWGEIGLFYFSSGVICLIFGFIFPDRNIDSVLFLISLIAITYPAYSIYYQMYVVKSWCVLCLLIQSLLVLEFTVSILKIDFFGITVDSINLAIILSSVLVPAGIYTFFAGYMKNSALVMPLKKELNRVKYNPAYVNALFSGQGKMPPIFETMRTIVDGDKEAANVLTVVVNPLCNPCAKFHKEIKSLFTSDSGVQVNYVFVPSNDRGNQVAGLLLGAHDTQATKALDDWFNDIFQDIDDWAKRNGLITPATDSPLVDQLDVHANWCDLANITRTPTIYLNSRNLPTMYSVSDIKRLIIMPEVGAMSSAEV